MVVTEGDVFGVMERPSGTGEDSEVEREKWWVAYRQSLGELLITG